MKAGVFDSGVGGLSVLKSILKANIFSDIVYYGDTARVPYGVKDPETIINFSLQALDFFIPHEINILIVACNTVSAYAIKEMQERSSIPVVGVINPGIQALRNKISDCNAPILVIATKATITSNAYQSGLEKAGYKQIQGLPTGLFVSLVEENILDGEILEACMKHYFSSISTPPQAVVLGCTHFPFIAKAIDRYFNHQSILTHCGDDIVSYLKQKYHLKEKEDNQQARLEFYASSQEDSLKRMAQQWLFEKNE